MRYEVRGMNKKPRRGDTIIACGDDKTRTPKGNVIKLRKKA